MTLAGLGYRDWLSGDIPSESDIDGYWQRQVIMHFATTAARDLAITAPLEGMRCYIAANKADYFYDGTAWVFREGWGTGSPEGVVTAGIGAIWHRTNGASGTTVWQKTSGTGNTGWEAIGGATHTFVRKSADESVTSSTTPQNDDHLLFAIGANETWMWTAVIFTICTDVAADLLAQWAVPAGATFKVGYHSPDQGATSGVSSMATITQSSTSGNGFGVVNTPTTIIVSGIIVNGATPGNVQFQWAQGNSNVAAVTVQANSHIVAHKTS